VRQYAVKRLNVIGDSEIAEVLLQLVQALRYEPDPEPEQEAVAVAGAAGGGSGGADPDNTSAGNDSQIDKNGSNLLPPTATNSSTTININN
jgi:hypothetical protein